MRFLPEIEAILSFAVVADELNFRRAAERLGIDHSALSRRIRDLEHRLGFALFERTTRDVRITAAGKVFRDENVDLLGRLERAVSNARLAASGHSGLLRIAYMSFAAAKVLPEAVARFRALRPDVQFRLTYMRSHAQKEALSRGEIDVGLMIGPWRTETYATTTVSRDKLCVFFPSNSAFARSRKATLRELSGQRLIMGSVEQWDLYRWILDDLFLRKGIVPDVALEASSISGMIGLVQDGLGMSIFPECIARLCPPGVRYRVLQDSDITIETVAVTARDAPAPASEFVAVAASAMKAARIGR